MKISEGSHPKTIYDLHKQDIDRNWDSFKFTGTIFECEAFIRLYEEGIINL